MKLLRKFSGAALALLLLVSAGLPASALLKSSPARQELPELTLAYGAERATAATGGYEWDYGDGSKEIADAPHPLDEGYRMPILLRRVSVGRIDLSFGLRPDRVTVSRWDLSDRGNFGAEPQTQTLRDLRIEVPGTGSYIYEVAAEWEQGSASYAFEFGLASDSTRMALSDLPEEYPAETALANGDVVSREGASALGNREKLDTFLSGVESRTPASVRVASYGEAGGPIVYDLAYDGKEILCTVDRTRDGSLADDLRGITERVYASAAIEWEHSVDSGGSTAYLRLSGASGGKLTVARFVPIEMAAEEESCPEGTEKLSVLIRNNTGDEASFDAVFALEAYLKDKWTAVPFDGAFDDWAGVLPVGSEASCEVDLSQVGETLVPARYRVVKLLRCGNRSLRVSAPFTVTEPADRLALEKPMEIGIMIGNGKQMTAATLTRRGRYEEVSPVTYVMSELGRFRPVPADWRLGGAAETDGASLTLSYADGSEVKLYLDPNTDRLRDGQDPQPLTLLSLGGKNYYSDGEAYARIRKCAAAVGGKAQLQ